MTVLNLGCWVKTSPHPEVINVDWSIYLRLKRSPVLRTAAPLLLGGERLKRFHSLPNNILVHNLANGLPFESNSVDAIYHSHLLEHLDRDKAKRLLLEVRRLLKPRGIQRIVVPDLEGLCRNYLAHIAVCASDPAEASRHDAYVAAMIEQCVRKEAYAVRQHGALARFLENVFVGDARRRGETHQWMYDRVNLTALLLELGYTNTRVHGFDTSSIPDWNQYGLDTDERGNEYKPGSLYLEGQK